MKQSSWKAIVIAVLLLLPAAALVSRLFFLQVMRHKLYLAQALGQQVSLQEVKGARGQIYCQNSQQSMGETFSSETKSLAINKDVWSVAVNPNSVTDLAAFSKEMSKYLDLSSAQILSLLDSSSSVVLKKEIDQKSLEAIKKASAKKDSPIAGVWWENTPARFYPQSSLAGQVLGFLGGQGKGQYGIEGYYDEDLQGKTGIRRTAKGLDALFEEGEPEPLDGSDVYLTLDYNIQFQAEALLKKAKEKYGIASGQILVIKPDSGKILALANYPSFNVNEYGKQKDLGIFQNGAVQKLFEPGSILKPITMATAINEGKITPDTTYVDTGEVTLSGKTVHNFDNKKYGTQTMTQVLEQSINTGAVYASRQISHKTFFQYLERFGFTQKTGIDLSGEAYSRNEALRNPGGPDINFATASFGQGIEVTPLQVVRAYSALANGGRLVEPYIVEKVGDGPVHEPRLSKPIISEQTAGQVRDMLVSVVENGYGGTVKIPGYYFAGKTGTAQIPIKGGNGYEGDDKTIQSFIGFGPAYHPEFLILVKLDQPQVAKSSLSAVPLFKELAQYIVNYWQIPPDYDISKK